MIHWLGFAFILLYPLHQIFAFAMIGGIAALIWFGDLAKHRAPALNAKDVLFLVYGVLAFLPVLADPVQGLFWARIVLYPWFITFVFQNIPYTEKRLHTHLTAATLVCIAIATVMLFQLAPGQFDFSIQHLVSLNRNAGFYYTGQERIGPNAAAYMSAAAIILLLTSIKFTRRNTLPRYALLFVPLTFLLVSGGRNAWVGTSLCLLLFALYRAPNVHHRRRTILRATLLLSIAAVVLPPLYEAISAYHGEVVNRRLAGLMNPAQDHSIEVRMVYWARALVMFNERPLGSGFDAYFARYERSPHNEILGQLVGAGWIATIMYVLLFLYLWWHVWRRLRRGDMLADRIRFACLSLLTVTSLAMVTENISRSTMNTYSPVFWTLLGMSFGIRRQAERRRKAALRTDHKPIRPVEHQRYAAEGAGA